MTDIHAPHDTHPSHDIKVTDKSFRDLGLSAEIFAYVEKAGFEHPTPIQAQVIPEALTGKDIIGCAQTGTGKTAAFVLPMVEKLQHGNGIRGLILCPTREIALQTKEFLDIFGHEHHLSTVIIIGGVPYKPQLKGLKSNPDILVATPGRLVDHMEQGNVSLGNIEHLVLDEADHMLDLGFLPQIRQVLKSIPKKRQTMMFSATMPFEIERLAQQFMKDPVKIEMAREGTVAEGITQKLFLVKPDDKKECLLALLKHVPGKTLIFTRTKSDAAWLCKALNKEAIPTEELHANLSQKERRDSLDGFKKDKYRVLVASDIAARGIDVPTITHVINYDIPENPEDYVHRIGRTGRYDAEGQASTIGIWTDKSKIVAIEDKMGEKLLRCMVPGVTPYKELAAKKKPFGRRF
jgi:ATP-dependent RNA helicase RhlE